MSYDIVADGYPNRLDSMKRVDLDGEFWSARDLMRLAGYSRWEDFRRAIDRAMTSITTSGLPASDHFRESPKMVQLGSGAKRLTEDVDVTRYGCSILFQNSDGRKPEIAALHSYFAVQTRKQELSESLSEDEIVARALQITQNRVQQLTAEVKELVPRAAQADTFRQADGLQTIQDLANNLKAWGAANRPGVRILQQDVFDQAGRLGLIIRGNTTRNNQPTARAIEAGWVRSKDVVIETNHGDVAKTYTKLTPRGYGRLWDGCIEYVAAHGTLKVVVAA